MRGVRSQVRSGLPTVGTLRIPSVWVGMGLVAGWPHHIGKSVALRAIRCEAAWACALWRTGHINLDGFLILVNDSLEVILAVAFFKVLPCEHSVAFSVAKRTKRHVQAPGHPVCSGRQRVGTKPCDLADRCGFQAPHSHTTTMRPFNRCHTSTCPFTSRRSW